MRPNKTPPSRFMSSSLQNIGVEAETGGETAMKMMMEPYFEPDSDSDSEIILHDPEDETRWHQAVVRRDEEYRRRKEEDRLNEPNQFHTVLGLLLAPTQNITIKKEVPTKQECEREREPGWAVSYDEKSRRIDEEYRRKVQVKEEKKEEKKMKRQERQEQRKRKMLGLFPSSWVLNLSISSSTIRNRDPDQHQNSNSTSQSSLSSVIQEQEQTLVNV